MRKTYFGRNKLNVSFWDKFFNTSPKKVNMKVKFLLGFIFSLSSHISFANDINADSASYYLKEAEQYANAAKVWEADKNFQKALKFNPSSEEVNIGYGNYLMDQRKYFVAVERFGKVLEKNINHTVALQKLADISFLLRRWNDVIIYGNKLIQKHQGTNVEFMLGKSYYELENYGQAKKYLQEAVAKNPTQVEAVKLLGRVFIDLSDYRQAIAVYNNSIQLDPNNKQLIYELGLLYYTMNQEQEAVKYFEMAGEKGLKKDLGYYENLGLAYLSFDVKKGVETLDKVLQNKPGNAQILFQIAQAYFKAEDYQKAANAYMQVFENDPSNSRALFMTGVAYQKKGDKNKGVAYCEQAIRMDPALAQFKTTKSIF